MAGELPPSPSSTLPYNLLDDVDQDEVEPAPGLPRPPRAKQLSSEFLRNLGTSEWEWKTSAKDFKPGGLDAGGTLSSSGSTFGGSHAHSGFCRSPLLGPSTGSSATESPPLDPRNQGGHLTVNDLGAFDALDLSGCVEDPQDCEEQLRLMELLEGLEQQKQQLQAQWEMERKEFITHVGCCRAVLQRYSVPLEEAEELVRKFSAMAEAEDPELLAYVNEPWASEAWRFPQMSAWTPGLVSDDFDLTGPSRPPGIEEADMGGAGAESIACTLKALFPHAKVQAGCEEAMQLGEDADQGCLTDPEVQRRAQTLQENTRSEIDGRALSSLRNLSALNALEVLQRVEELVEAQGGVCRNLSSMLQSVCRKMERKMISDAKAKAAEVPAEVKAGDETSRQKDDSKEYWTVKRIEKMAERCFETWYEGDRWRLKLSMPGSESDLSDLAVERFCSWLRRRLSEFKDAHGSKVLRQCQAEVDFAHSGLSDHGLWLLLDCLGQFEVQAGYLKLNQNRITGNGVLSLCEFIKSNKRAGQVYEMHLTDNQIDDSGALELLRTMKDLKHRYPPKREVPGKNGLQLVPVWLRLARNKVNAAALLQALSVEGISWCAARHGSGCNHGRCTRTQCPLVHHDLDQERSANWNEEQYEEGDRRDRSRRGRKAKGDSVQD
ncbi:unnamed protein product [Effrenium voratum]|uniref:Uncharacterized protein n=1 Tax=Effrenium voratum TaxID=2562239 RepID=A0AA36NIC2_9DINO|nr:unnamed protein product [Effrenium voratum]CAJ1433429.1 unnamed protein product [Effrenium voratum]